MGFGSIILLILKIIGIVLASILGFLLLLLIVFLVVPFRYRIDGHKQQDDFGIEAVITWLLHLLRICISYAPEGGVVIQARLFGRMIYDSNAVEKRAKSGKNTKTGEKKHSKKTDTTQTEQNQDKDKEHNPEDDIGAGIEASKEETPVTEGSGEDTAQDETPLMEKACKEATQDEAPREQKPEEDLQDEAMENSEEDVYDRILHAIESFFEKLKHIFLAPYRFILKLKYKKDVLLNFLHTEENKEGLALIWKSIGKLLRHMKPRKAWGYLEFGTSDPAATGYILAVLGAFYGKYGKSFRITPSFTEELLEFEAGLCGRVVSVVIAGLFLKVWFNRNFKQLRLNFERLKTDINKDGLN